MIQRNTKNNYQGETLMQQVKFRGKRRDNEEWIFGSLINNIFFFNNGEPIFYILAPGPDLDCFEDIREDVDIFEVLTETVGQFSGYLDKEGEELYHGDIVKTWNGNISYIYYEKGYWRIGKRGRIIKEYEWEAFEKIGNIFDNPKLLNSKIRKKEK